MQGAPIRRYTISTHIITHTHFHNDVHSHCAQLTKYGAPIYTFTEANTKEWISLLLHTLLCTYRIYLCTYVMGWGVGGVCVKTRAPALETIARYSTLGRHSSTLLNCREPCTHRRTATKTAVRTTARDFLRARAKLNAHSRRGRCGRGRSSAIGSKFRENLERWPRERAETLPAMLTTKRPPTRRR